MHYSIYLMEMDRRHKFILSEKYKFVYYEIQKCASETMREYFLGTTRKNSTRNQYGAVRLSGGRSKAAPYENGDYYAFTFVRNPWERVVSAWLSKFVHYHDPKHPDLPGIRDPELSLQTTFEEYVRFIHKTPDHVADCHFKSMHTFIPKNCRVGRVEDLEEDFTQFREEIGIPILPIPYRNTTNKNKPWREYYTNELRRLVTERFNEDIEIFEYEFES